MCLFPEVLKIFKHLLYVIWTWKSPQISLIAVRRLIVFCVCWERKDISFCHGSYPYYPAGKYILIILNSHLNKTVLYYTLPLEAQVYCASVRAAVHRSSKVAAPTGFDQRESGSKTVGTWGQLKTCTQLLFCLYK